MENLLKGSIRIPEYVEFRELDGEGIILNLENEQYYGLDSTGTAFWNLFTALPSLDDVYTALQDEYQVDPLILKEDLIEFVTMLIEQGLVEVVFEDQL